MIKPLDIDGWWHLSETLSSACQGFAYLEKTPDSNVLTCSKSRLPGVFLILSVRQGILKNLGGCFWP